MLIHTYTQTHRHTSIKDTIKKSTNMQKLRKTNIDTNTQAKRRQHHKLTPSLTFIKDANTTRYTDKQLNKEQR